MSSRRILDATFQAAVEKLRVPAMGTEAVAPLLASLINLVRPRRVLEVGMGYTTPFLAAALADVAEQVRAEARALAGKSQPYLANGAELDENWLHDEPALARPGYYLDSYRPELVSVDNLSIGDSSAGKVQEVLRELGLADLVTIVNADLRDCRELLPGSFTTIDLAWVDAWECLYFFDHFWDLINPDGGLLIMHYLMTYPEGNAILKYLAKMQQSRPGELEIVSLLESHKLMQNSITVLRRTSTEQATRYAAPGGRLAYGGALRDSAAAQVARATREDDLPPSVTPLAEDALPHPG